METLAAHDPGNAQWQGALAVNQGRVGDVLRAQGDLSGALAAYRKSLGIMETLAAHDPGNTQWQGALVVSHGRVGDVLVHRATWRVRWRPIAKGLRAWRRWRRVIRATPSGSATWGSVWPWWPIPC
jgi:hypothetical protein